MSSIISLEELAIRKTCSLNWISIAAILIFAGNPSRQKYGISCKLPGWITAYSARAVYSIFLPGGLLFHTGGLLFHQARLNVPPEWITIPLGGLVFPPRQITICQEGLSFRQGEYKICSGALVFRPGGLAEYCFVVNRVKNLKFRFSSHFKLPRWGILL